MNQQIVIDDVLCNHVWKSLDIEVLMQKTEYHEYCGVCLSAMRNKKGWIKYIEWS